MLHIVVIAGDKHSRYHVLEITGFLTNGNFREGERISQVTDAYFGCILFILFGT